MILYIFAVNNVAKIANCHEIIVNLHKNKMKEFVKIYDALQNELILKEVHRLYESSFPIEERRPWQNILNRIDCDERFELLVAQEQGRLLGFITWWDLGVVRYIEHFAVKESMRNNGVGGMMISQFIAMSSLPVLLEAELPENGEMARRRVKFYCRHGFVECDDVEYVQPAYAPHLSSVPLRLLITDRNNVDIGEVVKLLHRIVYKFV